MDVWGIISDFADAMLSAALSPRFERRAKVHQAVGKDVHQMKRVLDDKQFRTYMLLLGTTLHNRASENRHGSAAEQKESS